MKPNLKNKLHLFLAAFFLCLSLGQLQKIQLYSSLSIYVHELFMLAWLVYWNVTQPQMKQDLLDSVKKADKLIWAFLGWVVLGWIFSLFMKESLIDAVFYTVRLAFYAKWIYSLFWLQQKHKIPVGIFKSGIFISGCYILYFGILQYIFLPDTRFLQFLGWDDHYYRLLSTLLDPGFTGIIFILTLFQMLQLWQRKQPPLLLAGLLASFILGIALTYSRATYLAYGVSVLFGAGYFFWQKKYLFSTLLLGGLALLFIAIPLLPRPDGEGVKLERTSTIVSRTTSIETSFSQLQPWEWMTGQGIFTTHSNSLLTENTSHARIPDNWLVLLLTGTGVVGTALFLIILGKSAKTSLIKHPWLWMGVVAVLTHGLFNASVIYVFVLIWLGILSLPLEQTKEKTSQALSSQ